MWQIKRDLYLGDEVDARSRELLEERGITHILNCAEEVPCFFRRDFLYLHLEMTDPDAAFIEYIAELCTFIDRGLAEGAVLIHCRMGQSRSPSAIIAYLRYTGLTISQCIDLIRKAVQRDRDFIEPSEVFLEQIEDYFASNERSG
jgi:protein-tyrosine phosphatase